MPSTTVFVGRPTCFDSEMVVLVAHDLFKAHGFHRTTIRMITQSAGVPIGTLYYWFKSKQLLYGACLEHAARCILSGANRTKADSLVHDAMAEQIRTCAITKKVLTQLYSNIAVEEQSNHTLFWTLLTLSRRRARRHWTWYREFGCIDRYNRRRLNHQRDV